jgi:hypothetical protein
LAVIKLKINHKTSKKATKEDQEKQYTGALSILFYCISKQAKNPFAFCIRPSQIAASKFSLGFVL